MECAQDAIERASVTSVASINDRMDNSGYDIIRIIVEMGNKTHRVIVIDR